MLNDLNVIQVLTPASNSHFVDINGLALQVN